MTLILQNLHPFLSITETKLLRNYFDICLTNDFSKFHFSYFEIENTGKVKRDSSRKIQRVKPLGPLFVEQIETFRYTVLPFEKRGILSSEQCAFRTDCSLVQNRITLPLKTKKEKNKKRIHRIYIYSHSLEKVLFLPIFHRISPSSYTYFYRE